MTAQQQFSRLALEQHPLSAAFPSMSDVEIESLSDDIKKHGQREQGVMYDGMVLDGWHRYLACQRAGVQFKSKEFEGDDPVSFVISRNLHRRHLTASQRALAVVETTNWRKSAGRPSKGEVTSPLSNKVLAERAEVSERTIEQAKTAQKAGLGEAVRDGKVSVERASQVAKLPASKRQKALKEPKAKKQAPAPDAEVKKLTARIAELEEQKNDLADTARELEDKLTAFETTEPDEQQKEILKLQKRNQRLEQEIERLTVARNDCQNKCNELIRQVKLLQKKNGR